MTSNLPNYPGAAVVYERAQRVLRYINASAYAVQKAAAVKAKRRLRHYTPPAEANDIIKAMATGNEEALKAAVGQYLAIALDTNI